MILCSELSSEPSTKVSNSFTFDLTFTESAYKDIMGMPLNRDEAINFSEEVKMPPVTVVSPVITYRLRRAPSVNVKSKVNELDTFVLGSEKSSEHKMTNTQSYDLEVVA